MSVNTRYQVIFACLYWKSWGISCGLESAHPEIILLTYLFNGCDCESVVAHADAGLLMYFLMNAT